MTRRPFLAGTAVLSVIVLVTTAGAAGAATSSVAVGKASTSITVLDLGAAGHQLRLADLTLLSDTTTSPRVSKVVVTPVSADGTAYGRQSIDQASSPKGLAAVSTPGALAPVATLTSPAIDVAATSGPSNHAGATSLGRLTLLGMPVSVSGALDLASSVGATDGAAGGKAVTVKNLALPSIRDLLAALGLDLSKLPIATLNQLVGQLHLLTGAITSAQAVVTTAQAAVTAATNDLAAKTATLTAANSALTSAQATLATATTTVNGLLAAAGIANVTTYQALLQPAKDAAELLAPGLAAAVTAFLAAQTAEAAAQAAATAAQAAVTAAATLLATVTATLNTAITTLQNLISGKLDTTPLVSLTSLTLTTRAAVTSASKGGQHAEIVGGTITGLKVLGTDVLNAALGSSSVDLGALVGSALADVNAKIATLTGTLAHVLSTVPSLPKLDLPLPTVKLLTKTVSTSISGGFGRASTTVTGLSITIPGLTLPTSVALPGAASLPAFGGVTQVAGQLTSAPITLKLLTLHDQAAFRPSALGGPTSTGTPGSNGGLPNTGLPAGLALLSLTLLAGALAVRRSLTARG